MALENASATMMPMDLLNSSLPFEPTDLTTGSVGEWVMNLSQSVLDSVYTRTFPNNYQIEVGNTFWISSALRPATEAYAGFHTELTPNASGMLNSTSTMDLDERHTSWQTILMLCMMIVTCILIIVGNLTVLVVFHYTPALNNASGIFIKSLACADLGVGICCSFSIHSWFLKKWPYSDFSCAMVGYILAVAVGVSIIGLACLSIDRYIAIKKPLKYCTILTKVRARMICIGVWVVSGAIFMPSMFGWGAFHYNDHSYECSLHWEQNVAFSFFIISVLVVPALAISTFCYAHILKASFTQTQNMERSGMMFKPAHHRESNRGTYERLLAKIFLVIISAFYVTWLPFVITKTLRGINDIHIPPPAMFCFSWLGILNSFLNCLVYSLGHKSFRDGYFSIVRKVRRSVLSMSYRTSYSIRKHKHKKNRRVPAHKHQRFIDIRPVPLPIRETSL